MKIITAEQRHAEKAGAKILIVGPSGVGKTSLLRTLDSDLLASTLFIDIEAGDLAISNLDVSVTRPRTWADCRDVAVILGGPDPNLPETAAYSRAHYNAAIAVGDAARLASYQILFIDSLTAAARLSFAHAEQQPDARKDLRSVYGLHARQMIAWLNQIQQARGRHVILAAILEKVTDDFNRSEWLVQIEGGKTGRELPGIVDQILTMQWIDFGDGKPVRAFVCTSPNPWAYPAKDRSGKLDQIEEPHLGKLLAKLSSSTAAMPPKAGED